MEERIIELEIRFTEQQALLQELSEVLVGQQREIDLLKSKLAMAEQRLQAEPGLVDASERERPPHY
jgi:SlyX protein